MVWPSHQTGSDDVSSDQSMDDLVDESAYIPPSKGNFCDGQTYSDNTGTWKYNAKTQSWDPTGSEYTYSIKNAQLYDITITPPPKAAKAPPTYSEAYEIWNSDFVRSFTPDFINVGAVFSYIFGTF